MSVPNPALKLDLAFSDRFSDPVEDGHTPSTGGRGSGAHRCSPVPTTRR
ncbi:hypothetical protein [Cupriavidus necator]